MAGNVITAPQDPVISQAIELLKLISDPATAEAMLKRIAADKTDAEAALAGAKARIAEADRRTVELEAKVAETAEALVHQRRVEDTNKRRAVELDEREQAIAAKASEGKADHEHQAQALRTREAVLDERQSSFAADMLSRGTALSTREADLGRREHELSERAKAVGAREAEYEGKVAKLKAITG